ncbi:MAG: hypothetical protein HDS80_01320 [Bacteroidales bacterium]|nr:hypothetical protein [Bacteroidales bacterium]
MNKNNESKSLSSLNGNPNEWVVIRYKNPTPGELPIVGCSKLSGFSYFNKEYLSLVKECGLNIVQASLGDSSKIDDVKCTYEGEPEKKGTSCDFKSFKYNDGVPEGEYGMLIKESIANAAEVGLKIFVRFKDPKVNSLADVVPSTSNNWQDLFDRWARLLSKFKGNDAVAGWFLRDEPSLSEFLGLRDARYVILKKECDWNSIVEKVPISEVVKGKEVVIIDNIEKDLLKIPVGDEDRDKYKIVMCNLLPYMVLGSKYPNRLKQINGILNDYKDNTIQGWGPVKSYEEYYDSYTFNLEPQVVCYDSYPFEQNLTVGDKKLKLQPGFFQSLGFYSDGIRSGVPFWATIQTCDVTTYRKVKGVKTKINYKSCASLGMQRFAVFCSLAFGAKGLMYWRMTPGTDNEESSVSDWEEYSNAPIDRKGKKTQMFEYVKTVTEQVRKKQDIFLKTDDVSMRVKPSVTEWPEGDQLDYYTAGLIRIDASAYPTNPTYGHLISSLKSSGKGWVVSLLQKYHRINSGDKQQVDEYLIFVNLDWEKKQTLEVEFKELMDDIDRKPSGPINPPSPILPPFPPIVKPLSNSNDELDKDDEKSRVVLPEWQIKSFSKEIEPGNWKIFSRTYWR